MRATIAALPLILVLLSTSGARAVDIVSCDQVVGPGEVGELRQDLECASMAGAIQLRAGATLNLNGFSLRGDGRSSAVPCDVRDVEDGLCTVNGPGEISEFGVGISGSACRLAVRDLVLRGNIFGITGSGCDLEATNVTVLESVVYGIQTHRLRGQNLVVSDGAGDGIFAERIDVRELRATGNGMAGVRARRGRIMDSTLVDNGYDIIGYNGRLRVRRVECHRSQKLRVRRVRNPKPGDPPVIEKVVGSYGCRDD